MNSSERTSRINGFIQLIALFFGGPFWGIVLLAVSNQFNGWPVAVLWFFGTGILAYTLRKPGKRFAVSRAVGLAIILLILFQFVLVGLAALAAGGNYVSDFASMVAGLISLAIGGTYGYSNLLYSNAEYYLTIAVLWLLLGVPQRAFEMDQAAFKVKLDPDPEGMIQETVVGFLAGAAAILTGIYILLLHFGGGPLSNTGFGTLIAGIIFTFVLLVPAYKSLARRCWELGIRGTLSLKPLIMRWGKTLAELDAVHQEALHMLEAREEADQQAEEKAEREAREEAALQDREETDVFDPTQSGMPATYDEQGSYKRVSGKALPDKSADPAKTATAGGGRPQSGRKPPAAPTPAKPATGSSQPPANGSGMLRRLSRRAEPEPPSPPETKIVRQQPARQSRRKRSGKR